MSQVHFHGIAHTHGVDPTRDKLMQELAIRAYGIGLTPTADTTLANSQLKSNSSASRGGVVVFTGTLPSRRTRAQVTAEAVAAGYTVKASMTKNTTILVHGTGAAADAKAAEARELGIEALTEAEWTARLDSSAKDTSSSTGPGPASASASTSASASAPTSILAKVTAVDESDLVRASSAAQDAATGALTFGGIQPKFILADGESTEVKGSGSKPYKLKRTGDSYYCTCPAWRMQKGAAADCRTCKHLKALLGDEYEAARLGNTGGGEAPATTVATSAGGRPKRAVPVKPPSNTDARLNMEVLLAQKWTDKVDPTGWHASEKLDGMRAYWCATRNKLFSRNHNAIAAPDWFVESFPTDMSLDGELYVGRDMFSATMSIVRASAADDRWKKVQYHIFDIPSLDKPFEQRLQAMQDLVEELGIEHIQAVPHIVCTGTSHLLEMLETVESKSGEGIMLRKPKSRYVHGRSDTLLKVKTFADGEAIVIGHQLSTSSTYFGQLGALECRMASGKEFRVGSGLTADLRDLTKAPPVGTLITYKCQELTKDGVPRFPVFIGLAPPDRSEPSDPVFGGNANAGGVGSDD
ncbi:hypothetical protein BCR44DRAFT_35803 [Catenaria anguillulae PL171]|uniref:SWIM-type domain-containing protein n=1 Tax=Catenaria anguillulae PL171 TaxID=765915 RepID=A0A1Y2HSF4_9FUNG|nr:hypothetical protein BCR44DRAFT_35803 [Catenaria anguillulae PL171]